MQNNITYTEEQLVVQIRQGNKQAFAYLYDNYCGAINGIIYRLLEDQTLAEDVLQEAFIKIWNNFQSYDASKGRLFTWMSNIARNTTIDTLRSKGYRKQAKISGDENIVHESKDETQQPSRFDTIGLYKQLDTLKPEQRKLIILAYYNGYTQEEISKTLDMPLGTVKTRIRTALIELRKTLNVI